tara:strand:+ start:125 stop:346 length:222 start_codon:yes stop_codon:yes gene_type:complete
MRATERAPSDPFHVLERRHGLVEIVDRGTGVHAERLRVNRPHFRLLRHDFSLFANNGRAGAKLTTTRGVWQDD